MKKLGVTIYEAYAGEKETEGKTGLWYEILEPKTDGGLMVVGTGMVLQSRVFDLNEGQFLRLHEASLRAVDKLKVLS